MAAGYDLLVLGGGIIGCSIAWGAATAGARVAVIDAGDDAFRASTGNFGLLWTQGKGANAPAYARWTRASADLWPEFADALIGASGIDFDFQQEGGIQFVLSEADADKRRRSLAGPGETKDPFDVEFLPGDELRRMVPEVGPDVPGATYCRRDGVVNPLLLLRAFRRVLVDAGVAVLQGHPARRIERSATGFSVSVGHRRLDADKLVLAAGLANRELGKAVGIDVALFPQRGHLMVTERLPRFLSLPNSTVRQSREGTVLIGSTQEDAGYDKSADVGMLAGLSARAIRVFPRLGQARMVRGWACLRVMTPDGLPVYEQSSSQPGAFVATAHSGVTLAAIHARRLAPAILAGALPAELGAFRANRFGAWESHAGGSSH